MIRQWSIKRRALAAVLAPAMLMAFALPPYMIHQRTTDVEIALQRQGEQLARDVAYMSEFPLASGDFRHLNQVVKSLVDDPEIYSINVMDAKGVVLVHEISTLNDGNNIDTLQYSASIIQHTTAVDTFDLGDDLIYDQPATHLLTPNESEDIIGKVVVEMSTHQMRQAQRTILISGALLLLFALALSIYIGNRFSKSVTVPLDEIISLVAELKKHNYELLIPERSTDEIGGLARRINQLQNQIRNQFKELSEAHEVADQANRAKSEFLAVMSHELRTPLTQIRGILEILEDTSLNHLQKHYICEAIASSEMLVRLIEDILDFSMIEHDRVRIENEPFFFYDSIQSVMTSCTPMAETKELVLDTDFSGNTPLESTRIWSDPVRFRQILMNVITNAIKYTYQGMVRLKVRTEPYDDEHLILKIECIDTGVGIPSDKQDSIFELFEQSDSSASRYNEGVGLGLAITKRLIDLMGGEINVKSEVDVGSTFTLSFVLNYDVVDIQDLEHREETEVVADRRAPGETERILVVDDQPTNLEVLAVQLEQAGMTVDTTNNAKEALHMFRQRHYDMALIDVFMPGITGFDLARQIRAAEKAMGFTYHTPIFAITAGVHAGVHDDCIAAGMDDVITKPFRKAELYRKVTSAIQAHKKMHKIVKDVTNQKEDK